MRNQKIKAPQSGAFIFVVALHSRFFIFITFFGIYCYICIIYTRIYSDYIFDFIISLFFDTNILKN